MIARLRHLLHDPSVRWLAGARIISIVAAPVSLYFLVTRQPLPARGFYLIAINVVALGQLFETGMGTMVVQFATRVLPADRGTLRGAAERWFGRAALIAFAVGATIGTYVLARGAALASVDFLAPWAVVLVCTAAYIRLVPLVCLREGGGDVEGVQRMRALQAAAIALATMLGLWAGWGIGAAAWAAVAQIAIVAIYLFHARRQLPSALAPAGRLAGEYRAEQGRSARVWIAIWIAPQLLTPFAMLLRGASDAGDIGLHVALALAPQVLAVAWMHARYPRMGALAASGELSSFDNTARHAFVQASWVFGGSAVVLVALAFAAPYLFPVLAGRVLSPLILGVLLAGMYTIVVFQAILAWFRAFADEKFASQVVASCAAMATGGAGGAALGGALGAALGFATTGVIGAGILCVGFLRIRAQRLSGT